MISNITFDRCKAVGVSIIATSLVGINLVLADTILRLAGEKLRNLPMFGRFTTYEGRFTLCAQIGFIAVTPVLAFTATFLFRKAYELSNPKAVEVLPQYTWKWLKRSI